jgi:hypothetical protein
MKPIDLVMLALGAGALVLALLESRGVVPARVDQRVLMIVALLFWGRVALRLRMERFRQQREKMLQEIPKKPLGLD